MDRRAAEIREAYIHVKGEGSSAWRKWWAIAKLDTDGLYTTLHGALLSLGAPPHPEHLTQDLTNEAIDTLPPPQPPNAKNMDGRAIRNYELMCRKAVNEMEAAYKVQHAYNKKLNGFAQRYGLIFKHKTHDPAQFRKLFAAWVLHACKGGGS